MDVIILNFMLYLFTAIYAYRKTGYTLYTFFWLYYSFFSLMSVIVVGSGLYYERFINIRESDKLSFFPYLLNYITVFIILFPFRYLKITLSSFTTLFSSKKVQSSITIVCIFLFLYCLVKLYVLNMYANTTFLERRILTADEGEGIINRNTQNLLWTYDYISGLIHDAVFPFLILYLLKGLLLKKIKLVRMLLIILVCFFPPFVTYYLTSNRSGIFFLIINSIFFIFIFLPYLTKKIKKYILFIFSIILLYAFFVTLNISNERFETSDLGASNTTLSYFGETYPNLGYQIYNKENRYTGGARLFPKYFSLFTGISYDIDSGLSSLHTFWTRYTGVNIYIFKSIFGDLYLEFGTIGALIFVSLLSLCIVIYMRKATNMYLYYSLCFLYIGFCTNAVLEFGLMYGGYYVPRVVFGMILFSFFIRKLSRLN